MLVFYLIDILFLGVIGVALLFWTEKTRAIAIKDASRGWRAKLSTLSKWIISTANLSTAKLKISGTLAIVCSALYFFAALRNLYIEIAMLHESFFLLGSEAMRL